MAFEVPAYVTGHDWWRKSEAEVQPIVGPLQRIINNASPEVKKMIQRYADPIALVVGCVTVIGPSVEMEMEFKKAKREANIERARAAANQGGYAGSHNQNVNGRQTQPAAASPANASADPTFSDRIPELYPVG